MKEVRLCKTNHQKAAVCWVKGLSFRPAALATQDEPIFYYSFHHSWFILYNTECQNVFMVIQSNRFLYTSQFFNYGLGILFSHLVGLLFEYKEQMICTDNMLHSLSVKEGSLTSDRTNNFWTLFCSVCQLFAGLHMLLLYIMLI